MEPAFCKQYEMKIVAAATGLMVQANTCADAFIATMRSHGPGNNPVVDCPYKIVLSRRSGLKLFSSFVNY